MRSSSVLTVLLSQRKGKLLLAVSCSVIGTGLGLVPFWLLYRLAVRLFAGEAAGGAWLWEIAAIAAGAIALRALARGLSSHWAHEAAFDILYDLRMLLADKLGRLPLGYYGERSAGALKKVLHEDVEQIEHGVAHTLNDAIATAAVPLFTAALMFAVDWRMALAALLGVPLMLWLNKRSYSIVGPMFPVYHERLAAMNSEMIQFVQGIKVIKAFAKSDHSYKRLRDAVTAFGDIYAAMFRKGQWNSTLLLVSIRLNIVIILPVGAWLFHQQMLSAPAFAFFLLLGFGFNLPFYHLLKMTGLIVYKVKQAMQSIQEMLDEPELQEAVRPSAPGSSRIELERVCFRFGEGDTLRDVNLVAEEGKMTAIVGPSGSGKTTLAKLIPRFWDVAEGEIRIGGVDVRDMPQRKLMEQVAFVFQDVHLFRDTILNNIRIGRPTASDEEVMEAARLARVDEFVSQLPEGYATQAGENGGRLSGGQRQRISIARAILKNAPIVILDEATAFVDPENERAVHAALEELTRGKTRLVIAHRLSTIRSADVVYVMDQGTIVDSGTHEALFERCEPYRAQWLAYEGAQLFRFENGDEGSGEVSPLLAASLESAKEEAMSREGGGEPRNAVENALAGLPKRSFFRLLLRLTGERRGQYARGAALLSIEGLFASAPVICTLMALSELIGGTLTVRDSAVYAALTGASFLLQLLFNYCGMRDMLEVQAHAPVELRLSVVRHLRRLPLGFFQKKDTGQINSLLTVEVDQLDFVQSTTDAMKAVITPAVSAILLLMLDWRMALAALSVIPVALFILKRGDRIYAEVFRTLSDKRSEANSRMIEYIQGIQVIRGFNLGGGRFAAYERAMEAFRRSSMDTTTRVTPMYTAFLTVLELGFVAIVATGAILLQEQALDPMTFLLFLFIGAIMYRPLEDLNSLASYRRTAGHAMMRIGELLAEPSLPEPAASKRPADASVEFRDASFGYGADKVLDRVSCKLPAGGIIALVGPSGAGKTTLAHLIARFWDVQEGSVRIGGTDVRDIKTDELMAQMTMVFQEVYLFRDTVRGNVKFGRPDATEEEMIAACRAAQCHEFIQALPQGYDTIIGEGGSTLSGGERQRISIARAMLKNAPIVILDEATASIDPENERQLQRAFQALSRGKTRIVIAHKLSSIRYADLILVLDEGRIVQQGEHERLISIPGKYREMWGIS